MHQRSLMNLESASYDQRTNKKVDDYSKAGRENLLPRCIPLQQHIFNYSVGISLNNAMHLDKYFLAATVHACAKTRNFELH